MASVHEVFEMVANNGIGRMWIANALNARGIPAPASKHWDASTVHSMLSNRAYVGDRVWMRSRNMSHDGRALAPADDWVVAENAHEPLNNRELFERRKALASKRHFNAKRAKGQPVQCLLGRLIRYGRCGNNYVGRMPRATNKAGPVKYYRYYRGAYGPRARQSARPTTSTATGLKGCCSTCCASASVQPTPRPDWRRRSGRVTWIAAAPTARPPRPSPRSWPTSSTAYTSTTTRAAKSWSPRSASSTSLS